eukprot:1249491-Alexandrium_andersonii.AAC.1
MAWQSPRLACSAMAFTAQQTRARPSKSVVGTFMPTGLGRSVCCLGFGTPCRCATLACRSSTSSQKAS